MMRKLYKTEVPAIVGIRRISLKQRIWQQGWEAQGKGTLPMVCCNRRGGTANVGTARFLWRKRRMNKKRLVPKANLDKALPVFMSFWDAMGLLSRYPEVATS